MSIRVWHKASAWVSALLVQLHRAMREASERGTSDRVRLSRFFVGYLHLYARLRKSVEDTLFGSLHRVLGEKGTIEYENKDKTPAPPAHVADSYTPVLCRQQHNTQWNSLRHRDSEGTRDHH